jgi:hypothetical protein
MPTAAFSAQGTMEFEWSCRVHWRICEWIGCIRRETWAMYLDQNALSYGERLMARAPTLVFN